jgi:hypothetical protein
MSNGVFSYCSKLGTVILGSSKVVEIGSDVFANTPMVTSSYTGKFGSIYVPASLVDAYKVANYWSDIADRITAIVE